MSRSVLLHIHLFAIAFWLGVVAVEFLLERTRAQSRVQGFYVAALHKRIDLLAEAPAFSLALISGLLLIEPERLSGLYVLKIIAGLIAVLGNLWCLVPVMQRQQAAQQEDLHRVILQSQRIDRISLIAIPAGLVALGCGFYLSELR